MTDSPYNEKLAEVPDPLSDASASFLQAMPDLTLYIPVPCAC